MIKKELNVSVELVRGSGGAFEVTAGDALIFSKRSTGVFPEDDQLLDDIREIIG